MRIYVLGIFARIDFIQKILRKKSSYCKNAWEQKMFINMDKKGLEIYIFNMQML